MKTFKMRDVIDVNVSGSYPLNLRFKSRLNDPQLVNGPGIYIIALDNQPIYVGKHQPMGKSVFDRWLKSFETLTFRGNRLGFGSRSKQSVFADINAKSPTLAQALQNMPEAELDDHFRDRGVNTSQNGTQWVASNWDRYFKEANDISVAASLSFAFVRLTNISNQSQGNKVASALESLMFNTYLFEINYKSKGTIPLNSLDEAINNALLHAHKRWPEARALASFKLVY